MARSQCRSSFLRTRPVTVGLVVAALFLFSPLAVSAVSTSSFYEGGSDIYDDWDVCRTRGDGPDGFLAFVGGQFDPVIAYESLGDNANSAYVKGFQFAQEYANLEQRAEVVFAYARDGVSYNSDHSQFGYVEFAQNADELAGIIAEEGKAYGDCEDYAFLLGVMYLGAEMRAAIVLAPDHAATLVYLPGYVEANRVLTLEGEDGWIWAEATGGNNPLGWMPDQYMRVELAAEELTNVGLPTPAPQTKPVADITRHQGAGFSMPIPPFWLVILVLWLIGRMGRRGAPSW
jgi:hypothetical protein